MREKSNSLARYALMISWRIIHFHAFYCLLSLHSYPINPSSPPAFPSSFSLSLTHCHVAMLLEWRKVFFFAHSSVMIMETVLKFNTYPQKINVHARNGDVGGGGWWKDTEKNEKQNFLKKGNFAYKFLCYFSALKAFCNFEILSHSLTHSLNFWVRCWWVLWHEITEERASKIYTLKREERRYMKAYQMTMKLSLNV